MAMTNRPGSSTYSLMNVSLAVLPNEVTFNRKFYVAPDATFPEPVFTNIDKVGLLSNERDSLICRYTLLFGQYVDGRLQSF